MSEPIDVVVAGLGAVGSAAAYHCALRGMRVAGFDRYEPPHTLGSTHGGSRIIRRAYFEGAMYVPLLNRAYELWRELESVSGVSILHLNGALTIAPADSHVLHDAARAADEFGISHEMLEADEVRGRFPGFRLRGNEMAVWEPEAGWLHPETAVRVHLEQAERRGAVLRFDEPVESWSHTDGSVTVRTPRGSYTSGTLILCAGGWMAPLLAPLDPGLTLERQVNAWYRPRANGDHFNPERCPVYVWEYDEDHVLYGFPYLDGGVKAGLHHHGDAASHPDELDREVQPADVAALTEKLQILLPDACGDVVRSATCFYTNTPDEHYLIDVHPDHPAVVFASACSGHGFKASNAVGEALAAMVIGEPPAMDISPYRLR